jgi:copper transporter 1
MLVFMTYNVSLSQTYRAKVIKLQQAYLVLAVVLGAAIGHYIFEGEMNVESILANRGGGRSMACH